MGIKIVSPTRPMCQKVNVQHVFNPEDLKNLDTLAVEQILTVVQQNNGVPTNARLETYDDEYGCKVYLWSWFETTIREDE